MDYANREEWEVVHAIIVDNTAGVSPKQIASFLGRSLQTVYKWGQDPEFSGSPIPKDLILPFTTFTKDVRLLEFYLYHIGYYAAPLEEGKGCNGDVMDEVMRLDVLRGELSRDLLGHLKGRDELSVPEGKRLMDTAQMMIEELRTFQEEVRIKIN